MGYQLLGDLCSSSELDQCPNLAFNKKIHKLSLRSIDFVLESPQADLDFNVYMELPIGIYTPNGGQRYYVLKLNKPLYHLKQAITNWFEKLKAGLNCRYFEQLQVNPCLFLRKDAIVLVFVDDYIILSKDSQTIEDLVISLKLDLQFFS